jgi:hypothetical protein
MIKLSTKTILKNIIDSVIAEWQQKLPDKKLDDYDNWRLDILDRIDFQLKKQNISLDELIVDSTDKSNDK